MKYFFTSEDYIYVPLEDCMRLMKTVCASGRLYAPHEDYMRRRYVEEICETNGI